MSRDLNEEYERLNAILAELVEALEGIELPVNAKAALKVARDYLA